MELSEHQQRALIDQALQVRHNAYAPYSDYAVGAALLGLSGKLYLGVNVENAAYPSSICAERSAVFSAVTQGERQFAAIAVVTENGGAPCGACRQVLSEFGLDTLVLLADAQGKIVSRTTVARLLPQPFLPADLVKS